MRNGMQWPVGIIGSIILIVIACAVTIYIALLQPVKEDADMMLDYYALDTNANDVIVAGIMFNKKYKLTYTGKGVSLDGSTLSYKIEDINGNPVNDATVKVVIIRPVVAEETIVLDNPRIENGNYIFEDVKVTKKGRWNILAKVTIGEDFRHMNLKSDTIQKNVFEYGFDKPMRNAGANGGRTLL
jgi:nitrogen fixation protein FixH